MLFLEDPNLEGVTREWHKIKYITLEMQMRSKFKELLYHMRVWTDSILKAWTLAFQIMTTNPWLVWNSM